MNVLCVIPARSGSKGLKDKNIQLFNGKPLLHYPIKQALKSRLVNDVVVTTDSQKYADIAKGEGALVPFLRPKQLSLDTTSMEETLQHALLETELQLKKKYDICVFITCTDVFRKDDFIDNVVQVLIQKPEIESCFIANLSYKNYWEELPYGQFQRISTYMQLYGQRQERKRNKRLIYREDTGLASASKSDIWRKGRRIGDSVEIIIVEDTLHSIDIHNKEDLLIAEYAYRLRNPY